MKSVISGIILAGLLLMCLFSGEQSREPAVVISPDLSDVEPAVYSLRSSFNDAANIVDAVCMRTYINEDGLETTSFAVAAVYAGSLSIGARINCPCRAERGERYLLYLDDGGDVSHSEGTVEYTLICDAPFLIDGDSIVLPDGQAMPLDLVKADMQSQAQVVTFPAQSQYYPSFEGLVAACDEILIARVDSVEEHREMLCRSSEKGEVVENQLEATQLVLSVLNGLGGSYPSDSRLTLVIPPAKQHSIIDAESLKAVNLLIKNEFEEGDICIFFLVRSPDAKSDQYFLVNPAQGYLRLEGDSIIRCYANHACSDIRTLKDFIERLNPLLGF